MESKEQLVNNIKEWIKIDSEITQLKAEIKERTNKKKNLTENLVKVMKSNSIDCFDINGGALVYKKNRVKKPINGKTLLSALQNYYKNDSKVAEEITKHVMDSREEQIKETIKRKIDK
jgi:phage gpG-like protein